MLLSEGLKSGSRIGERLAAAIEEVASSIVEAEHRLHAINNTAVLCGLETGLGLALHKVTVCLGSSVFLLRLDDLGGVDLGAWLGLLRSNVIELLGSALQCCISLLEFLSLILWSGSMSGTYVEQ